MPYQKGNAVEPTFIGNIWDSMCQNRAILHTNPTIYLLLNVICTHVEGFSTLPLTYSSALK